MNIWTGGGTDVEMDGSTDGWMDGWTDEAMDGQTDLALCGEKNQKGRAFLVSFFMLWSKSVVQSHSGILGTMGIEMRPSMGPVASLKKNSFQFRNEYIWIFLEHCCHNVYYNTTVDSHSNGSASNKKSHSNNILISPIEDYSLFLYNGSNNISL